MREETAQSLREIEDMVNSTFGEQDACFRGQSCASWDLVPSAYRALVPFTSAPDFDPTWSAQVERDTYRDFEMEAGTELRELDILERMSRAQHHGVPTRMLDWTANVGIAAYFAIATSRDDPPAVWGLNLSSFPFPDRLGRQHRGGGFRLDNIAQYGRGVVASFAQPFSQPAVFDATDDIGDDNADSDNANATPQGTFIVWRPHRVDERLRRQEGLLAWYHSFDEFDLVWNYSDHIKQLELASSVELLLKITIEPDKRDVIQSDVLKRGLHEHHLFADLDGLGRYLAREHHENMGYYAEG